ncbi:hypothetical protein RJ639_047052 [Escallonia herrerae]|uniref:F-box domain-containing protein n=1 Tax=Escallonia herrerae TaxID=1293975 RepID=A0AA88W7E7_9ASTE|nr:hypothetical protein RJ639_047052 [Escallonia herrerae]
MGDAEPIEGLGSLPRDLIIDILSRLPVKVLCTFKAVSKQWRSLISSDPHFKKLHRNRSARVPKLLLSRYDYVFNLETVSFESNVHFLTIDAVDKTVYNKFDKRVADAGCVAIACCNLMCLVTYKAIHVSNPSTQEFVRLPDNRHRPYDPIMGFGYLASENVYKLVVLSVRGFFDDDLFDFGEENPDEAYDMGCEVLTIREGEPVSGAWRDVGDLPCLAWKKNGVCVDGEIYWMALADSDGDLDKRIVVMSLGDEEFVTILLLRNVFAPPVCVMELVELKGRLCLVNHRKDVSTMEIWILMDRAKCLWNMECSIHLYPVDAHIQVVDRGLVNYNTVVPNILSGAAVDIHGSQAHGSSHAKPIINWLCVGLMRPTRAADKWEGGHGCDAQKSSFNFQFPFHTNRERVVLP